MARGAKALRAERVRNLLIINYLNAVGKFSEYKVPLKSMPVGEKDYSFRLDKRFFENMECGDVRDADLEAALRVAHRNGVYELDFRLTGEVTVACDRCLDDLRLPIDSSYRIIVKYGDGFRQDSDELLEIPESDDSVNVAYMIYDTAMLAIPIKHVHPLGKCNRAMSALLKKHRATRPDDPDADLEDELLDGIEDEPAAGDAPTDPRWDALKGLNNADKE